MRRALLVVDVQQGFNDVDYWGHRSNPECEANIAALMAAWREAGQPIVRIVHDSLTPGSPLAADTPGNAIKPEVSGPVDLEVRKSVHSSFHGTPDLNTWLQESMVSGIAVCGITTNMCCETTARTDMKRPAAALFSFSLALSFACSSTPDRSATGNVSAAL